MVTYEIWKPDFRLCATAVYLKGFPPVLCYQSTTTQRAIISLRSPPKVHLPRAREDRVIWSSGDRVIGLLFSVIPKRSEGSLWQPCRFGRTPGFFFSNMDLSLRSRFQKKAGTPGSDHPIT